MSTIQFERPPTFDVKIVGGKKIVIWSKQDDIKNSKISNDLPKPVEVSKPSSESTSTETNTVARTTGGLSSDEVNKSSDSHAPESPQSHGDRKDRHKANHLTGNEERNKREIGDTVLTSDNINQKDSKDTKDSNDNLPQIISEENSPMKRRSASPPSLSSSFKVLPPIKKELDVSLS